MGVGGGVEARRTHTDVDLVEFPQANQFIEGLVNGSHTHP